MKEKIAVVQHYINIRKNVEVRINIPSTGKQLFLLDMMYHYAVDWFKFHGYKIQLHES